MLDFGFLILVIGCAMLIWSKLSARAQTKALSPRPILLRMSAEETIRDTRKKGSRESYVLIAIGMLIVIIAGVMN